IKQHNKLYTGFIMFEGKLPEVENVPVTLDKELNTDIESDVEIIKTSNETLSSSTTTCKKSSTTARNSGSSKLSKLAEIPFSRVIDELDELTKSIDDIIAHESGKETETDDDDYREQHSSTLKSTTTSKNKAKKTLKRQLSTNSDDEESFSTTAAKRFCGRELLCDKEKSHENPSETNKQLISLLTKSLENSENIEKQNNKIIKIQKALSKHKIYIPLEDPEDTTKNEAFQTTMVFEHEGRTVDALKLPAHPDQKNLYVTKLIDIYYKAEDFINIDGNNVTNNDGYQFIKG
ncbi:unnamed protein product, partial [Didymodactylos carnosus]